MKQLAILLSVWIAVSAAGFSQNGMPKAGPEHEKLNMFAGSWALEGDVKPNPMGPGGKMSENEKCEWMEGSFFLVCHVDFSSANMGSGSGLSVMGYSAEDKAYTYREFNSWGEFEDSRGSVNGNTWTWTSEEKMGDTMTKSRFTIKFTSATSYEFTYDMSPDGAKWTTVVDGKATKK
jgi:Protein of unknown function (DUF1579)